MTFDSWLARLRDRGFVTCPTSSAVPVELRAVTLDGVGLHLRCRGVRVRLEVYRPGRAAWQIPLRDAGWSPEESLELWERRPLRGATVPPGGQLVFTAAADRGTPDTEIILDGSRTHGWHAYEAGLLRVDEAAILFESMLLDAGLATDRAEPRRMPRPSVFHGPAASVSLPLARQAPRNPTAAPARG